MSGPLTHRCSEDECPYLGKPSATSCQCHKPEAQMLREIHAELLEALEAIEALEPEVFTFPEDWEQQIEACSECQGWAKNHPIQRGICDTHRRPIWDRERHDEHEREAIGPRARRIASAAIAKATGAA